MKKQAQKPPLYLDAIIAGFGGQGILLMGNLLAYAAMEAGLHSTFIPVYGAEMRGGTANCTVVLSTEEIGSPLIKTPKTLIIMNQPSYKKFVPRLAEGGICLVNTSLVETELPKSSRSRFVPVDTAAITAQLENPRLANMVALGAYLAVTQVISLKAAQQALAGVISSHYAHLIPLNEQALALGYAATATNVV